MFKLRSLSGLLAFDAAARHGSLTLAADELGRTQSAVSQQVKHLEEQLGLTLFVRRPRQVVLTPDGRAFADAVRGAFEDMEQCVWQLKNAADKNLIRITMVHSFALKWLSPRLPKFNKLYPQYDVRFEANDRLVDLGAEGYDLAIRYGDLKGNLAARDPGYDSVVLLKEHYAVVYAPDLCPGVDLTPQGVGQYPLLSWVNSNLWGKWFQQHDIMVDRPDYRRHYSHAALMVQAAVAGAGVAIAPLPIVHDAVMAGELKVVKSKGINNTYVHRVVVPRVKQEPEKVAAFRAWLIEEFECMQREAAEYLG